MAKISVTIAYKKVGDEYQGHILDLAIFGRGKTIAELKKNLRVKAGEIKNVKAKIADLAKPYREEKMDL